MASYQAIPFASTTTLISSSRYTKTTLLTQPATGGGSTVTIPPTGWQWPPVGGM